MNNIINKMLSANSIEELEKIIATRIAEEKQEFLNQAPKTENYVGNHKTFIAPPTSTSNLKIQALETFLDPNYAEIFISTGIPTYSYYFDDESEIYKMFAFNLSKLQNSKDINQIFDAVLETIFNYIGGSEMKGSDETRLGRLKKSTHLGDNEKNKFSVFKNSQDAWCTERSCIAQQLFKFIGLDSKIVTATISNNNERQIHTFNLVKTNGKTYLYDSSVMSYPKNGEKYNPIAYVLPEDVFDKNMTNVEPIPEREVVGKSGRKYKFIYDLENRKIYENTNVKGN